MAERFNKMKFNEKIRVIMENPDILQLACDGNWWGVKVKDKEMQEQLECDEIHFDIASEWDYREMLDLITILNIDVTDI